MKIPSRIPYLPAATLLWGLYALVWTRLEASLLRDGVLAGWGLALVALWLAARALGGQTLPVGRLVALGAATGLAWVTIPVLVLLFSAITFFTSFRTRGDATVLLSLIHISEPTRPY